MPNEEKNPRHMAAPADPMFMDRWSPRSFVPDPLEAGQVAALFEAARWAPSCFNEQPWLFVYALTEEARAKFTAVLAPKNRTWAGKAPLLVFAAARKNFQKNGKPNRHAAFDAGAAWVSLAFQARKMGLYAHAMAGFDRPAAQALLGLKDEEYEVMAAIAVGRKGEAAALPEDMRAMESPNDRKPLAETAREFKA
ncbi:MAG: nitroreductase family protein [Planctomycetota bacterium]